MATKLTLTVEEQIIKKAKSYAKQMGRSLSELVENYLHTPTAEDTDMQQISPKRAKRIINTCMDHQLVIVPAYSDKRIA